VGAEFTYVTIYGLKRISESGDLSPLMLIVETAGKMFLCIAVPACATKQIVNVSQLCSSCYAVAEYDAKINSEKRQ
jgi:hypothetical protein